MVGIDIYIALVLEYGASFFNLKFLSVLLLRIMTDSDIDGTVFKYVLQYIFLFHACSALLEFSKLEDTFELSYTGVLLLQTSVIDDYMRQLE